MERSIYTTDISSLSRKTLKPPSKAIDQVNGNKINRFSPSRNPIITTIIIIVSAVLATIGIVTLLAAVPFTAGASLVPLVVVGGILTGIGCTGLFTGAGLLIATIITAIIKKKGFSLLENQILYDCAMVRNCLMRRTSNFSSKRMILEMGNGARKSQWAHCVHKKTVRVNEKESAHKIILGTQLRKKQINGLIDKLGTKTPLTVFAITKRHAEQARILWPTPASTGTKKIDNNDSNIHEGKLLMYNDQRITIESDITQIMVEWQDLKTIPASLIKKVAPRLQVALKTGHVYIHCQAGVGRSATIVAALLILEGQEVDEAIAKIKKNRNCTHISDDQKDQLNLYKSLIDKSLV